MQPATLLLDPWPFRLLASILVVVGGVFVVASIYQLGIIGTYLGDYFGFLMKARVTAFPYNVTDHPMYEGATMSFLGYALWLISRA